VNQTFISVTDDVGCPAVLGVRERDTAAELDDTVVADVDAVVVVAGRAPYMQVVTGLKSAVHAETLPEGGGPGLSRNA
jgi:hypothetical protein